jgi:hypothetical protein
VAFDGTVRERSPSRHVGAGCANFRYRCAGTFP